MTLLQHAMGCNISVYIYKDIVYYILISISTYNYIHYAFCRILSRFAKNACVYPCNVRHWIKYALSKAVFFARGLLLAVVDSVALWRVCCGLCAICSAFVWFLHFFACPCMWGGVPLVGGGMSRLPLCLFLFFIFRLRLVVFLVYALSFVLKMFK